jgi:hypothetical protein
MHTLFASAIRFKKAHIIVDLTLFLFCVFLLLWSAFNNGYPLVYSDTGAYVQSSFLLKVPIDGRPIGYGLFLLTGRLFNTLWVPVFFQSLITTLLLFRIAYLTLPETKLRTLLIFSGIIITVLTTDVSKYVSWIMADIFTSWLFLGGLLFFISIKFIDRFFSAFIVILSFTVHNSHIYLSYFSFIILLFFLWKFGLKNKFLWKDFKKFSFIILFATIGICTSNLIFGNGFTLTNSNSVFYINKLAYHGVLTKTLDRYCPEKNWKLCDYKEIIALKGNEEFSSWYLWVDDSPLEKMGGWKKNNEYNDEYRDIILHSLKSFFATILLSSIKETVKQLIPSDSFSELRKYNENDAVIRILRQYYPDEYHRFMNDKQQTDQKAEVRLLPLNGKISYIIFLIAAFITLGICLLVKDYFLSGILFSFLIFTFLNAVIIGFIVSAEARYQGRIFWLMPYLIFLVMSSLFLNRHKKVLPDLKLHDADKYKMQDNKLLIS